MNDQQKYNDLKLGERGAIISIIAYICLSALKLVIGYMADSEALKADGLNNTTDIIASIAVLIGLKLSQKPADSDHPYGHWKVRNRRFNGGFFHHDGSRDSSLIHGHFLSF